jgi:hypothetical protein
MSECRKRAIVANLPRLHAERQLAHGDKRGWTHRTIYDVVLAMTESPEAARAAKMDWYAKELEEKARNARVE